MQSDTRGALVVMQSDKQCETGTLLFGRIGDGMKCMISSHCLVIYDLSNLTFLRADWLLFFCVSWQGNQAKRQILIPRQLHLGWEPGPLPLCP